MQQEQAEGQDIMDKRNIRTSSAGRPHNGPDCKRTDNVGPKNGNRYNSRKNDGASRQMPPSNFSSNNRKNPLQKNKAFDKRPRTRGYQNDQQRAEVTQGDVVEKGSALLHGSKKANLNHLLNFSFAPRSEFAENGMSGRGVGAGGGTSNNWKGRGGRSCGLKFNKERFLQANCQFVVKETCNYTEYISDPDTLVSWELVEQVRIFSHEVPSCPICLYPPTAAKMTRCGHIYCWSCILHYLSLEEKRHWRKCPICYEAIHQPDLKSVVSLATPMFGVNKTITMKLMKRERGSTYSMPYKQWTQRDGQPYNIDDDVDSCYSKILLATPDQVKRIVDCEKTALETELQDVIVGSLEASYVEAALRLLQERLDDLQVSETIKSDVDAAMQSLALTEVNQVDVVEPTKPQALNKDVVDYTSAFDDEIAPPSPDGAEMTDDGGKLPEINDDGADLETHDCSSVKDDWVVGNATNDLEYVVQEAVEEEPAIMMMGNSLEPAVTVDDRVKDEAKSTPQRGRGMTDIYYVYQAADGQNIYLHSVNARCLVKEYGCWENCPDTITANIVHFEGYSMSEDLRRRLRHLSHLPLTCEFRVAELDMKPPIVSQETLHEFSGEIKKLKQARQKRSRDEKREYKKMQAVQDRKDGIYPELRCDLSSSHHFPEYNMMSAGTAGSPTASSLSSSISDHATLSPYGSPVDSAMGLLNPNACEFVPTRKAEVEQDPMLSPKSSMSFAQMLQAGSPRRSETWPSLTKMAAPETSAPRVRRADDSEESDNEDRTPVPVFQNSFRSAIQEAMDSHVNDKNVPVEEGQTGGSGKKKKGKKKLLFTTFMARTK